MRVLRAIEADRSHLTRLTQEQRRELLTLAGLVAKPERHDLVRMAKAFRRADRAAARQHDRKVIEQTGLRVQRKAARVLAALAPATECRGLRRATGTEPGTHVLRLQTVFHEGPSLLRLHVRGVRRLQLREARANGRPRRTVRAGHRSESQNRLSGVAQAVAGRRARDRHHALPGGCSGAVLTGTGLCLFRERLEIHGLDLRHTPSVELFTRFLLERLPRLDHIVNNACQTVRRPAGFFQHWCSQEAEAVDASAGSVCESRPCESRLDVSPARSSAELWRTPRARSQRRSPSDVISTRTIATAKLCSPSSLRRRSPTGRSA